MTFNRETLLDLIGEAKFPALTVTFPTFRSPPDVQQNPVRYKNMLRKAEKEAAAHAEVPQAFEEAVQQAWSLAENPETWEKPRDGMALFVCPGLTRLEKLGLSLPECLELKETFALRPFLGLFAHREPFLVLAAAYNDVRLYESSGETLKPVTEDGIRATLDEFLAKTELQNSVNFHTSGAPSSGGQPARFHALGESFVDAAEDLRKEFAARIARVADAAGAKRNHPPMVVIADDRLIGEIQSNAKTQVISTLDTRVSPAELDEDDLLPLARQALEPRWREHEAKRLDEFRAYYGDTEAGRASANPPKLALAALEGRIATLFVCREGQLLGRIDEQTGSIETPGQKGDLIDDLIRLTVRTQGEVIAVERGVLPKGAAVAALYRW